MPIESKPVHGVSPSRRWSLRRRLPLLISALIAVVVITFLWTAYRAVEQTLIRAGVDRAAASGEALTGRLSDSIPAVLAQLGRLQQDARLHALLQDPTDETRDVARAALGSPAAVTLRRIEIWSADGSLLLEIASSRAASARGLKVFPRGDPPTRAEISPIKSSGDFAYYEVTAEIRDEASPAAPLGYLRRFGELVINLPLNRLLGDEAELKIGGGGGVWTDFETVVDPPPLDAVGGSGEYIDARGARVVGTVSTVQGAPWSVWVAYPRSVIVAPARAFLRRMIVIGLVVLLVAALIARTAAARITRPLADLSVAAEAVAAGDYSGRVATGRSDEIGRLGDAFNAMTLQLERDQSGRKVAEEALRDREASFRALFSNNPLAMWVYDVTTLDFIEVNDAAVEHYGYSHDEFLAMRITDIRPEEDIPRLLADVTGARHPWRHTGGWRHRLKSGQIIDVEVISHTLTYGGRAAVLVVAQDVTERRRLEAQFLQAQKMEAVGQLTGGVAHDFNNLLTGILGYCDLLLEATPPTDVRRADLMEIKNAGQSAASLTARLLSFSRKQMIEPKVLDLNAVVTDMGRMLERIVREDIALELHLAPDLGHVSADPAQLQQVLLNLVVNAKDAMPTGGRLTLETGNVRLDEQYAGTHLATVAGDYVMLAVSDTGIGMSPEVQAHVFEPFFTTKQSGKGTGLGLSSVYGIVKQNRGNIWIYSEPGHGTTFKVYLPRVDAPLTVAAPALAMPAVRGNANVLVVEDNAAILSLTRRILERDGFTVLPASSPGEAVRIAQGHGGTIHLLLSDVVMPEQSGPALALQLRAAQPEMRVLYMSGYTDDAIVRHGIIESTTAFIQKPFTPAALLEKVRAVLGRSTTQAP